MKWKPKHHQSRALKLSYNWMTRETNQERYALALWLEMGLGKTSVAATLLHKLMDEFRVFRTLVVSTVAVVDEVWPAELEKWDHLRDIPWRTWRGATKDKRAAMAAEDFIGLELLTFGQLWSTFHPLHGCLPSLDEVPWDMIIIDESSKMRTPGSRRFHSLRDTKMRRVYPDPDDRKHWKMEPTHRPRLEQFPYMLQLTGTPAPNGYQGLWAPTYLMDSGLRLGKDHQAFLERWFTSDPYTRKTVIRDDEAQRQIEKRMATITISMRAQDYLDLPPLNISDVWIDLPRKHRAAYDEFRKSMELELSDLVDSDHIVTALNGASLTSKCRQYTSGAMYTSLDIDPATGVRYFEALHEEKFDALDCIRDEYDGANIVVVCGFKHTFVRLAARYGGDYDTYRTGSSAVIERWNRGDLPLMGMHADSGGHGLNLQAGGYVMVFVDVEHAWDTHDQVIARIGGGLRRADRPAFIYRILMRDTVDLDCLIALTEKRDIQDVLKSRMSKKTKELAA